LHLYELLPYFYFNLTQLNPLEVCVGIVTLVTGLYFKRCFPRVPNMLAALVVGAVVGAALNWFFFTRNGAAPGIALVGKVAAGLPPISTSDFSVESLKKLAPVSLAVATLLLHLEFAILLGVLLSLILYLHSAARPKVLVRSPDPALTHRRFRTNVSLPTCPQLAIVSVEGDGFFWFRTLCCGTATHVF